MNHSPFRFVLAAALAVGVSLLASAPARATTSDCAGLPDDTPCATQCLAAGTCQGERCAGGVPRPDGTACATGDPCTDGDHCESGICLPGSAVVCAARPCESARCDRSRGCVYSGSCDSPKDMQMDGGDGGVNDADLGPPAGLANVDAGGAEGPLHVHGSGCQLAPRRGDGELSWVAILTAILLAMGRRRPSSTR